MTKSFSVHINDWPNGNRIPSRFAFGKPGKNEPFAPSDNISPAVAWFDPPEGTRSFVLLCHDPDVPSSGDDVNQVGKTVPADLPRVDFYHWVLINIPADCSKLPEGAGGEGITAGGKPVGPAAIGLTGKNDYTGWFAGDEDMAGTYGGYDGPCPPWNDSIIHHYHFTVYALDVEKLALEGDFSGSEVVQAMQGHVLAQAAHVGTYAMNPALKD